MQTAPALRHERSFERLSKLVTARRLGSCRRLVGILLTFSFALPTVSAAKLGIDYEVTIVGIADSSLRATLESVSDSVALSKERPPATLRLLRLRVQRDVPRLLDALRAEGYYDAQVTTETDPRARPVRVTFKVEPGSAYLIKTVDIQISGLSELPGGGAPEADKLGLRRGEIARARPILDAQGKVLDLLKTQGFPFPQVVEKRVVVDHADRSVAVTFRVETGASARFGKTVITGLRSVDETFVRSQIPWREGDRYDADLLGLGEKRLSATGLFAIVRVTTAQKLNEEGLLPVTVELMERKHRSVSAGMSYKTDEGPGAKVSWEHGNLFHHGERMSLDATASDFTRAAEAGFRRPGFWREDQSLALDLRIAEDSPDSYTSRNLKSSVLINRDLTKGMTMSGGVAYKNSRVSQFGDEESFSLVSLPLNFGWDTSDNLLDPTRGGRLALQLAPYYDTIQAGLGFVKAEGNISRYLELLDNPPLILAGRATLGIMAGAGRLTIPADERFYAGGGGSIRGYPFQSVGPLAENKGVGGKSLVELSAELRWKFSEHLGLVAFVDGGSAYAGTAFDSGERLLWSTGVGLRYFTPIGPLRLDVGVPVNRRPEVDESLQIYVSLGQAF